MIFKSINGNQHQQIKINGEFRRNELLKIKVGNREYKKLIIFNTLEVLTKDTYCKTRIVMTKEASMRKKSLLTTMLNIKLGRNGSGVILGVRCGLYKNGNKVFGEL